MFDNEINLLKKDILSRFGEDKPLYVDFEGEECTICEVDSRGWFHLDNGAITGVVNLKPYLRPMSSMTEKEKDELYTAMDWYGAIDENGNVETRGQEKVYSETFCQYTDWLDSNFFDWRGLIPLDLALEATEGMYK